MPNGEGIDLSDAAIAALIVEAGFAELTSDPKILKELVLTFRATLTTALPEATEVLTTAIVDSLRGPPSAAALAEARTMAARQAETLVTNMYKSEIAKVGEVIAQGIEAGDNFQKIHRNLEVVKSLDGPRASKFLKIQELLEASDLTDVELEARLEREFQKLLRERKKTIAQTEQRFATSEANRLDATKFGATHKTWITVGDERVDEDVCAANEAQGVIPIKDTFQSGHDVTPGHPNCRCTIGYVFNEAQQERSEVRAKARAEATAAAAAAGETAGAAA